MQNLPKWKIFLSIICTIFAVICALPNFTQVKSKYLPHDSVNLGLDLRGGAHLLLDVDFDTYLNDTMENLADTLRKSFREDKIGYKNLLVKQNNIQLELRSQEELKPLKRIISKIDPEINVEANDNRIKLSYSESRLSELLNKVVDQSIEIVRMRVDSTGTKEPILQKQGDRHILLQVPGEEDPTYLKNILGKTAKLIFHLVDENANVEEAVKGHVPMGSMLVQGDRMGYLVVKKKAILGGDSLTTAAASFDQNSQAVVSFSFNSLGSKLFGEVTKNNVGKHLAIVLDNKLLSAPTINQPIMGGSGIISGDFTVESANELALLLRAGSLPAPLKIIEERSIGPNLGADSIESGKKAGIIGFAAVCIFMVWSYGLLGLFANIALSLAMLYVLALLSLFQATLTLPGIAGIILTMGMAVDANVLIYERIKEELNKGTSNLYAIKTGFESAFATILDSNLTTLIVAFLLYIFGVGAIKGFAVALTIGIISSMFSAIIITKLLIDIWVKYFKPKKLGLV
ncbi:preprotein translocase subunit SecD [Rickettsia bellii]|uniref:Protein translocase subunit SecD n=3 Tax=Rickettsia bellii TaxID=33990 RepID=SECD_RICBR|nr:protein translocase subunit SecD [Rickettsia bellii]Q1RIN3.1 RecName: Full=Protein translocase subunit SecD [Rickettsia bellii RML369-C]ABE04781.1 Protein-export membrane protein secD [Rickettsia bellii RML369-C]ABV79258.1 preprotein translocase subunit SecD [Rickettsia bellii OSU 85-389]ARD86685.1 preprotein translocase subunit SecD [Rickettsia bellii]KJV89636.1 protein-export membrane protein SecD [Rickettsia bellii str. RML An4]KJV91969.1 protein-export membrane protein SecD [Rickettsia